MDLLQWGEYHKSELPAIELLKELGYEYKDGNELSPNVNAEERTSLREVILKKRLIKKIKEFNPWINENNIKQVIRKLTIPESHSLLEILSREAGAPPRFTRRNLPQLLHKPDVPRSSDISDDG